MAELVELLRDWGENLWWLACFLIYAIWSRGRG